VEKMITTCRENSSPKERKTPLLKMHISNYEGNERKMQTPKIN